MTRFRDSIASRDNQFKKESLETLATYLLSCIEPFCVGHDIDTSTNQLDQVIRVSGHKIFHPFLGWIGTHFIAECKNEQEKVDVTWMDKVHGLLTTHSCKLAIIFSRQPMTRNAIELQRMRRTQSGLYILNVSKSDLEDIESKGKNFLTLLEMKYAELKLYTTNEVDLRKLYADDEL